MPTYRHPLAGDGPGYPPARIHVSRADNAEVDDTGTFEAPRSVGEAVAARFDMDEPELRADATTETCEVVKADDEVCGRELPCPYHSEGDDE